MKYKSLNKKKVLLIITEILVGAGSAVGNSSVRRWFLSILVRVLLYQAVQLC